MHYLYRVSSGEVGPISSSESLPGGWDALPTSLAVVTDPTVADGAQRPLIYDGTRVRSATQQEADGFAAAVLADEAAARKAAAKAALTADNLHGRILRAVLRVMLDEVNTLRTRAGVATRTEQQVATAILSKMEEEA